MGLCASQHQISADMPEGVFLERFQLGSGPISVAVKDVVDIKGYPTRLGSAAFDDVEPASAHADVVDRLLTGGGAIVGKTNMHELAYGVTGLNKHHGTPQNPNFPDLIPGGSSSGSAVAVAAGLCDAAIGTDTGGSIRVPAACCGVLGLKPTFGRVSRVGLTPRDTSLDCVGPFAKNAETLNAIMAMITDDWRREEMSQDIRIGWLDVEANPELIAQASAAANEWASTVDNISAASFHDAHVAGLKVIGSETYAAFGYLLAEGKVDPEVASRLSRARDISDADLAVAEEVRIKFTGEINHLLTDYDVLALPTLADFPPRLGDAENLMAMVNITNLCRPFNLSGHPAISIPLHPIAGRPASLQLVAAKGNDERLVSMAALAETNLKSGLKPHLEG